MIPTEKPKPGDYPDYYAPYLHATLGEDLADALGHASAEEERTHALVPAAKWDFQYAPGKWTTKEVFQHVIDTERVFAYRALCFARNEQAHLPGMDENAYQAEARTAKRPAAELLRELRAVRQATIALFAGLDAQAMDRGGTANGKHITVRALGWIIAGHSSHHMRIIRERYLG